MSKEDNTACKEYLCEPNPIGIYDNCPFYKKERHNAKINNMKSGEVGNVIYSFPLNLINPEFLKIAMGDKYEKRNTRSV